MKKIILIGYMGVGKTTIAQLLAETKKLNWVDLDCLIEKNEELSITELFKLKGEIYFRKIEHEILKKEIEKEGNTVISTGGGTPCYANNHFFLNGDTTVSFYLKASIDVILDRLKNAKRNRPLIVNQTDDELKEFIAKNLFDRSYFYNQATFIINIDNKSPDTIIEEILKLL